MESDFSSASRRLYTGFQDEGCKFELGSLLVAEAAFSLHAEVPAGEVPEPEPFLVFAGRRGGGAVTLGSCWSAVSIGRWTVNDGQGTVSGTGKAKGGWG